MYADRNLTNVTKYNSISKVKLDILYPRTNNIYQVTILL